MVFFWAFLAKRILRKVKVQPEQVSLLVETEFEIGEEEKAYEKYNKEWFTSFRENLIEERVKYSAAVLTEESHKLLVQELKNLIPENWKVVAHHMTLCLGELPEEERHLLGSEETLKVVSYSLDLEKEVMAVKVESSLNSKNELKHVTIALGEKGSAVMSNELTDFTTINVTELNSVVSYVLNNKTIITTSL